MDNILILLIIAAIVVAGVIYALCWNAGDLTEQEALKPCPVCHKVPKLGYCCGEYFVAGEDPDCPGCGTAFTEMHSSPQLEIDAWNRRAEDGK